MKNLSSNVALSPAEKTESIFIAGGELGPIEEWITSTLKNDPDNDLRLFFGVDQEKNLNGIDNLRDLSEMDNKFTLVAALNSAHPSWEGEVGLITDVVRDHLEPEKVDKCFLYGTEVMIRETVKSLINMGISEGRIYRETITRRPEPKNAI